MLETQFKGSNTPSIRSLVVDEERMGLGHWLVGGGAGAGAGAGIVFVTFLNTLIIVSHTLVMLWKCIYCCHYFLKM